MDDEITTLTEALSLSPDPIFAIDEQHRIIFWNNSIKRVLGYDASEAMGKRCNDLLGGTDTFGNTYCADGCPITAMAQHGDQLRPFRLRLRNSTGALIPVDVAATTFRLSPSGRFILAYSVRLALDGMSPRPAADHGANGRLRGLTTREREVLSLIASGYETSEVADQLGISRLTARNHIQHIFEKLDVHSKSEAVSLAYRENLVGAA